MEAHRRTSNQVRWWRDPITVQKMKISEDRTFWLDFKGKECKTNLSALGPRTSYFYILIHWQNDGRKSPKITLAILLQLAINLNFKPLSSVMSYLAVFSTPLPNSTKFYETFSLIPIWPNWLITKQVSYVAWNVESGTFWYENTICHIS